MPSMAHKTHNVHNEPNGHSMATCMPPQLYSGTEIRLEISMAIVKMSFGLLLETGISATFTFPRVVGPLFHRFVPNGRNDAVFLTPIGDPYEIRVWFERSAKLVGGFLEWEQNGSQFDESIMRRQAKLDGGPLRGEMLIDVSGEEMASLLCNPKALNEPFGQDAGEDPAYVSLGKRVINVLQPRLTNFINTLRNQYGQYWLEELSAWDSKRNTLGTYCSSVLHLLWWDEEARDWRRFLPTNSGSIVTAERPPGRGYEEYLTKEDWRHFQQSRCLDNVSTEVQLLGNATRALDFGEYRQAFLEVMSALELAVARRLVSSGEMTKRAIQSFLNSERQNAQVAVVLLATGAEGSEIEDTLQALKIRNRIAHEGYLPSAVEATALRNVMRTIQRLVGLDEIKSPVITFSNQLSAP